MRHWENFISKFGFGDGESYPVGIHIYLKWYMFVVNHFAEKIGSRYRVYHPNMSSIHNEIRIDWELAENDIEHWDDERHDDDGTEGAMLAAIDCARLFNVDQYIDIDVMVDRSVDVTWGFWVKSYELEEALETFMIPPAG